MADERHKEQQRRHRGDLQINRIPEAARRRDADHHVAHNAASDRRHDAEEGDAENIQMLSDAGHRAADGKRNRSDHFKYVQKCVHNVLAMSV